MNAHDLRGLRPTNLHIRVPVLTTGRDQVRLDFGGLLVDGVEAVDDDPLSRGKDDTSLPALWCPESREAESAAFPFGRKAWAPPLFCWSPQETEGKKPESFFGCGNHSFFLPGMVLMILGWMVLACVARRL